MAEAHNIESPRLEPTLRWLRRAAQGIPVGTSEPPRLGVLSGTFNPPTRAHLALAHRAAAQLRLGEILFVIPEEPPHKGELEASLEDRAGMLLRAMGRQATFSAAVCSHGLLLEIHRALQPHYPQDTRVIFLAGRDAAERILLHWPYADAQKALEEMFARFDFAVASRGGKFQIAPGSRVTPYRAQVHALEMPEDYDEVSATHARERLAKGMSIEQIVPAEVAAYIAQHNLYR